MTVPADQSFLDAFTAVQTAVYELHERCRTAESGTIAGGVRVSSTPLLWNLSKAVDDLRPIVNGLRKALLVPQWKARYDTCTTKEEVHAFVVDVVELEQLHVFSDNVFETHEPAK
jgi:hypothetical protein